MGNKLKSLSSLDSSLPGPGASVAVLLPAHNGASWIELQIQTILNQQNVSVHLFLSVDPSTDSTREICSHFADCYDNVTLIDEGPRSGGAAAHFLRMLRDLDLSKYEYVALSDQDDLWFGHKLQRACELLKQSGAACYSGNVIAFWADGRKKMIRKDYPQRNWDYLFEAAGPGCTYVMKKNLVFEFQRFLHCKEHGLKNIHLHDWLIYAFARSKGFLWFIDPTPFMFYRQHHANVMGANSGWRAMWRRFDKLKSGWALQQIIQLNKLLDLDSPAVCNGYFVRRRADWLRLALRVRDCRRRPLDQLAMFGLCVYLFITGRGQPHLQEGEYR